MSELILIYVIIVSLCTFVMYGIDKYKAIHKQWRIPESSLLMAAFMGGGYGATIGMYVFRHKTKHVSFKNINTISILLWTGILMYVFLIH